MSRGTDRPALEGMAARGLLEAREAWASCVHEAGHAIVAVALGYALAFSDVSEALASIIDAPRRAPSPPRTGFTRIYQLGEGHTPDIAFAVAGRVAEAVHELIDEPDGRPFDTARWRESSWAEDDDLKDALAKAL